VEIYARVFDSLQFVTRKNSRMDTAKVEILLDNFYH